MRAAIAERIREKMANTLIPTHEATGPDVGFYRTAAEGRELLQRQRDLNRAKRPGYIAPSIKQLSEKNQLYIFNVGPKRLEGSGASYGTMMIAPCLPEGVDVPRDYRGKPGEYSAPLVIPGIPFEMYDTGGNRLETQFHGDEEMESPGWDFACQVMLGYTDAKGKWEGKFLAASNSLERFGVGISKTWPPGQADLILAKRKMHIEYAKMVQQANEAHAVGKFSAIGTDDHFVAARALGKTPAECRWMEFSAVPEVQEKKTKECPACGEEILAIAKKCKHCGEFIVKP